jgi:S-adenosylmethionine decarboxylase
MSKQQAFGKHYLVELVNCDPERIKFLAPAKEIILRAVRESQATYIGEIFHQFEPFGISGIVLIAESHLSFHTWPEAGYVGLDIFTCGTDMNPDIAIAVLKEGFAAREVRLDVYTRGF